MFNMLFKFCGVECFTVKLSHFAGIVLPWRWLSAVATLPPTFLLLFSIFIVESPRYYILKNDRPNVKLCLQRLRGAKVGDIMHCL